MYIGIDPGLSGGLASSNGWVFKMPREMKRLATLDLEKADKIYVENVWTMPGNGAKSARTFMMGYGGLLTALDIFDLSYEIVAPRTWQKRIGIEPKSKTETKTQWKNRLKDHAQLLFPNTKVTLWNADALLIAEYGRLMNE